MTARISFLTVTVLSAAASSALAGSPVNEPVATGAGAITYDSAPSRWRFGAGYAPLLGLKTEFNGLGTFNRSFAAQPTGGGVDYDYDDGFVHVDSSNNLGGKTWNWSYDKAAQYNPAGGGSISYTLTNSLADASATEDGDTASGVECYTYFDMGAVGISALKDLGATWGFRGGVHYARVNVDNQSILNSGTLVLTDRFELGGTIPPKAPFTGSFGGPGPLIGDSPDRTTILGGLASVSGSRDLDVHLTTLSFGSYLEMPFTRKFSMMLEGGLNAAVASGTYDFQSATTIGGLGTQNSSGKDTDTTILPGAYLGLGGIYQLNPHWALHASGRYQYMDDFELGANGSSAELSFGSAFIVSFGALYSF
ncbi:MAG: hypothetical protein ABIS50_09645 [Luteolibacter sp.]|uniref:hypothetical protein n=1 Tax=Luteolibacter sp. TaxID=1962973 RepID=UPI0032652635